MHRILLDIPTRLETERLILRCYGAGDGPMYYAVSCKNRSHLARYEAGNVVMSIHSEEDAEILVRELAVEWSARNCFFMGAFDKAANDFVAQIYVGPVNWDTPEFQLGYFADVDYEGQGFVTEACKAALKFAFVNLKAHRVRLECDDTNLRSQRVAERCGFLQEGHFRENKRHADGTMTGTLHYGFLKSEFEAVTMPDGGTIKHGNSWRLRVFVSSWLFSEQKTNGEYELLNAPLHLCESRPLVTACKRFSSQPLPRTVRLPVWQDPPPVQCKDEPGVGCAGVQSSVY